MGEQFTNGGLPDKEWYELEEVAERWSKMTGSDVSVKDILHYGLVDWLDICFRPGCVSLYLVCSPWNWDEQDVIESREEDFCLCVNRNALPKAESFVIDNILSNGEHKSMSISVEKFHGKEPFDSDLTDIINNDILSRKAPYIHPGLDAEFIVYASITSEFDRGLIIKSKNLVIPTEEMYRFEKEHGIGQARHGMPSSDRDDELKIQRMQRTIAAMATAKSKDGGTYQKAGKPNALQIAQWAIKAITDDSEKAPKGYGKSSLREAISTSLDAETLEAPLNEANLESEIDTSVKACEKDI